MGLGQLPELWVTRDERSVGAQQTWPDAWLWGSFVCAFFNGLRCPAELSSAHFRRVKKVGNITLSCVRLGMTDCSTLGVTVVFAFTH